MKFLQLTTFTLLSFVASEEAQGPQHPFFTNGLSLLNELINKSAPVLSFMSTTIGGPEVTGESLTSMVSGLELAAKNIEDAVASVYPVEKAEKAASSESTESESSTSKASKNE